MLVRKPAKSSPRRAVAAVEMAFLLPLLLTLIIGVWELGRIIQVYQMMMTAARDGARLAAQGKIINTQNDYTFIRYQAGSPSAASPATDINPTDNPPYVYNTIMSSLQAAGVTDLTGVTLSFAFIEGDTTRVAPFQGLKNERFKIVLTVPYANVRWTNLTLFAPPTLRIEVYWQMMVDDPFTVNTTLPTWNPINN